MEVLHADDAVPVRVCLEEGSVGVLERTAGVTALPPSAEDAPGAPRGWAQLQSAGGEETLRLFSIPCHSLGGWHRCLSTRRERGRWSVSGTCKLSLLIVHVSFIMWGNWSTRKQTLRRILPSGGQRSRPIWDPHACLSLGKLPLRS